MAAQETTETIETTEIVETIDLAPRDSGAQFVPADGADEEETLAVAAGQDRQLGDPEGLSAADEPEPTATNLLASSTQESPDSKSRTNTRYLISVKTRRGLGSCRLKVTSSCVLNLQRIVGLKSGTPPTTWSTPISAAPEKYADSLERVLLR